mgnify:CR=1 FL=1
MQRTTVTDAELLRHLAESDEYAFRTLYDRYWIQLYEFTVSKVEFQETAEEIVQDIFIDLWKRRENLLIERLDSYLYRAVKYRVIDVIRAGMVRKYHEESAGTIRYSDSLRLDEDEEFAYKELYEAILEGLTVLPEKTSEIFRLNRLEQLSASEISERLQIPVRTVEYHITQALRAMKAYLKDFLVVVWLMTNL